MGKRIKDGLPLMRNREAFRKILCRSRPKPPDFGQPLPDSYQAPPRISSDEYARRVGRVLPLIEHSITLVDKPKSSTWFSAPENTPTVIQMGVTGKRLVDFLQLEPTPQGRFRYDDPVLKEERELAFSESQALFERIMLHESTHLGQLGNEQMMAIFPQTESLKRYLTNRRALISPREYATRTAEEIFAKFWKEKQAYENSGTDGGTSLGRAIWGSIAHQIDEARRRFRWLDEGVSFNQVDNAQSLWNWMRWWGGLPLESRIAACKNYS